MQKGKIFFTSIISLAGWFALVLQFCIMYNNAKISGENLSKAITRYFSYFTILTNIAVALSLTVFLLKPLSRLGNFFSKPSTFTAVAVNITIVGLIYNTLLRNLWKPEGLQLLADELLHLIIPVLYIMFWVFFVPHVKLKWTSFFQWLIYPLVYLIYILIYGNSTHWYPYPFVDVAALGYPGTLANAAMLLILFVLMSLLFITADRMLRKKFH
jgi:hypothetical protein